MVSSPIVLENGFGMVAVSTTTSAINISIVVTAHQTLFVDGATIVVSLETKTDQPHPKPLVLFGPLPELTVSNLAVSIPTVPLVFWKEDVVFAKRGKQVFVWKLICSNLPTELVMAPSIPTKTTLLALFLRTSTVRIS